MAIGDSVYGEKRIAVEEEGNDQLVLFSLNYEIKLS